MLSKNQIKYIQSLVHKKQREEYGQYVVEGTKLVHEAVAYCPDTIVSIYARPDWLEEFGDSLGEHAAKAIEVEPGLMQRISSLQTPQGVLAVLTKKEPAISDSRRGITLILDGIQDPGNLGTIIRTADWFGVQQLICSSATADCYNPKVVQATMGSIFRINVRYADLTEQIQELKPPHVIATSLLGTPLGEQELPSDAFVVIGSEANGISDQIMALADIRVRIPGGVQTESLNAAVATGIILYALTS